MKKLMFLLCFACTSIAANASYLLWQVTSSEFTEEPWDTAKIFITEGNSYSDSAAAKLNVGYVNNDTYTAFSPSVEAVGKSGSFKYVADIGTLGDSTTYSYYVELYNSAGSKVARSSITTASGSDINSQSYVYADTASITITLANLASVAPWHAGGYKAVPEPTSGLMLLLGAAMLGLKRKNRSVA